MSANANWVDLQGAASFFNGLVQIDQYDTQIFDIVRRESIMIQRIQKRIATGDPSRYILQSAIGTAQFDSKRSLNPTASSPTRSEGAVTLKAISGRVQFGLYDQLLGQVMPQQFQLKAQDLTDMVKSVLLLHGQALWTGTDEVNGSLVGDNTTNQYVGIPKQISTTQVVVDASSSIVSAIRREVANRMNNQTFVVRPTAIYCNPMVIYFIEEEMKQANNTIAQVEIVPGVKVTGIQTAAGVLPLIPDVFLGSDPAWATAAPSGQKNYPFVIVDESLVEYHHLPGTDRPALFKLGLTSDIHDDYVAVMFGGLVVKGGNVAHSKGVVQRA